MNRSLRRWLKRTALALLALVVAIAVLGATYQAVAGAVDARRYPPPGRLVAMGGYRLHLHCRGPAGAGPTVVMDAGLGESSLTWWSVTPRVAQFARVCAFDRPGYGWSDPGPRSASAQDRHEELHALLHAAGVPPPYVLVGHSLGGAYAYGYAQRYPEEVAGLVLVDPGDAADTGTFDEWTHTELSTDDRRRYEQAIAEPAAGSSPDLRQVLPVLRALAPFGVPRLALALSRAEPYRPAEAWAVERALRSRTPYLGTVLAEIDAAPGVYQAVYGAEVRSGDTPLLVLSSGLPGNFAGERASAGEQQAFVQGIFQRWKVSRHRALAERSTRGQLVVADRSGRRLDERANARQRSGQLGRGLEALGQPGVQREALEP
jgi:pimeloyl-ACP methyl ester carboxylesterase